MKERKTFYDSAVEITSGIRSRSLYWYFTASGQVWANVNGNNYKSRAPLNLRNAKIPPNWRIAVPFSSTFIRAAIRKRVNFCSNISWTHWDLTGSPFSPSNLTLILNQWWDHQRKLINKNNDYSWLDFDFPSFFFDFDRNQLLIHTVFNPPNLTRFCQR